MRTSRGAALAAAACALVVGSGVQGAELGELVRGLTKSSEWTLVDEVEVGFTTHHPQGMVRIGEGRLIESVTLGEGDVYHPGGIDYDGEWLWVPVAEYRPDSASIIYRVDPKTLEAVEVLRFSDHIGGIVRDPETNTLHGVSWGSRRFYAWPLDDDLQPVEPDVDPKKIMAANPSHYIDYQDCHHAGDGRMLCSGLNKYDVPEVGQVALGGLELVDLKTGRPVHQVPVPLWVEPDLAMTNNPAFCEARAAGLRCHFMPEDDRSTLFVYEVKE